ncbi:MAG: hypothetical protein E7J66_19735 [Klebsiella pneumoniae]|nr:hypothetical protein [Klebsiella pneumoniae]
MLGKTLYKRGGFRRDTQLSRFILQQLNEEVKRTIKSAFESIGDTEWPECTSVPAADSLARLAEIDSEVTVLHQREGELIAAANLEGIDIGQGY